MRFLSIGGAGYLGTHLTHQLLNQNHEVVIFDNLSGNLKIEPSLNVTFFNGDITLKKTFSILEQFGTFDGVFHLAAKKSVSESLINSHLYFNVNL